MFFGEDFANNTDSGLRRRRRSYINVCFRLRFRFARRSGRFLHNCRIALRLLFAARRIGNSGLFLLTSHEQRRTGQNADILIHNYIGRVSYEFNRAKLRGRRRRSCRGCRSRFRRSRGGGTRCRRHGFGFLLTSREQRGTS
jgi:hypothetical protein